MIIGLAYDLRSEYLAAGFGEEETGEFDREETIDAIESALRSLGHHPERIGNARQLVRALASGRRWDLVFNICEGMYGIAREAQVPAVLEAYGIPCTFSDPLVMALSLDKGRTKAVLRQQAVPTPDYRVVTDPERIDARGLDYPLFLKPLAEGTGKGIDRSSIIDDSESLVRVCRRLLTEFDQPVLIETFLPGREFTVGLVGTGANASVLGTLEIILREGAEDRVYSYENKEQCERFVDYALVTADDPVVAEAERIALDAWRALDCRDAGRVDLRCDGSGRPQFLEVNPLAGLHPRHSDLPMLCAAIGMEYRGLIERIIGSASERIAAWRPREAALRRLDGNTACGS
ncbi:MAG: D-alanine--D-alanine ligase [Planctomycetes bacterium]|nr:D-alanine--D-alanine ligase [Planctomycetota bacterium]